MPGLHAPVARAARVAAESPAEPPPARGSTSADAVLAVVAAAKNAMLAAATPAGALGDAKAEDTSAEAAAKATKNAAVPPTLNAVVAAATPAVALADTKAEDTSAEVAAEATKNADKPAEAPAEAPKDANMVEPEAAPAEKPDNGDSNIVAGVLFLHSGVEARDIRQNTSCGWTVFLKHPLTELPSWKRHRERWSCPYEGCVSKFEELWAWASAPVSEQPILDCVLQ